MTLGVALCGYKWNIANPTACPTLALRLPSACCLPACRLPASGCLPTLPHFADGSGGGWRCDVVRDSVNFPNYLDYCIPTFNKCFYELLLLLCFAKVEDKKVGLPIEMLNRIPFVE